MIRFRRKRNPEQKFNRKNKAYSKPRWLQAKSHGRPAPRSAPPSGQQNPGSGGGESGAGGGLGGVGGGSQARTFWWDLVGMRF